MIGEKAKRCASGTLALVGFIVLLLAGGMSDGGVSERYIFPALLAGLGMMTAGIGWYNHLTGGMIEDKWEVEENEHC